MCIDNSEIKRKLDLLQVLIFNFSCKVLSLSSILVFPYGMKCLQMTSDTLKVQVVGILWAEVCSTTPTPAFMVSLSHTSLTLAKLNVRSVERMLILCEKIKHILLWCMENQAKCSLWAKHTGFFGWWRSSNVAHVHACAHTSLCVASPYYALSWPNAVSIQWFKMLFGGQ
jgi:hypothetical protein